MGSNPPNIAKVAFLSTFGREALAFTMEIASLGLLLPDRSETAGSEVCSLSVLDVLEWGFLFLIE